MITNPEEFTLYQFADLMEELAEEAMTAIEQPPVIVPVPGDGSPVKFSGAHFGGRAWAYQDAARRARELQASLSAKEAKP